MPTTTLSKDTLIGLIKKKVKDADLIDAINMLGPSVESMTQDEISVEVPPNRPDLLSTQGMGRALASFFGVKPGLRKYSIKKSGHRVIIDDSVSQVRPFTACAIVKGLKCTEETIKDIIQIQEKLHITYGRNRRKCAIGVYPLEHIRPPIKFLGKKPEEIVFAPLDMSKELTAPQILALHPTGREYAHLLEGAKRFPVFIDAKGNVLSLPPIINSNTVGKITEKTKDVFVEVSGFDFEYLNTALCMMCAALADMGGQIMSMDVLMKGKRRVTPDFAPRQSKLDPEYVNRKLGTAYSDADLRRLLARMGHDYANKNVLSPRWRSDLLHPIDYAEEVAIAAGYPSIAPVPPRTSTVGKEQRSEALASCVRDILAGIGLIEIKSYHLVSESSQTTLLGEKEKPVMLANAFSEEYTTLRRSLIPTTLLTLKDNKNSEYPQSIFEIGTVFHEDPNDETGVREDEMLAVALCENAASFTKVKQILQTLSDALGVKVEVVEASHPAFIPGRAGTITINGVACGCIGEIHPGVLEHFSMEMPVAYLELGLGPAFSALSQK